MTELTQWVLWGISMGVAMITFMISWLKAKRGTNFLRSNMSVLQESNKSLSAKISGLSTKSELNEYYVKLKKDINQALHTEKPQRSEGSDPKIEKSLAEAFGIDGLHHKTERDGWEYFTA